MCLLPTIIVLACGKSTSSKSSFDLSYFLERQYTGENTNTLTIDLRDGGDDDYTFSISSLQAQSSIEQDTRHSLVSQTITFSYLEQGIYSADFKVSRKNGTPYIFEILTWEYNTGIPDPPVISFAKKATRTPNVNLLVSDSRTSNTTDIWLAGDLITSGKGEPEGDGFWEKLPLTSLAVPVVLTSGDGMKSIDARFRNIFGVEGERGVPGQIILKQTPPSNCDLIPIGDTISTNKLSLRMSISDPYQTSYSAFGDVVAVVSQSPFKNNDIVNIYVTPQPGLKTITVTMEDIAGNICLEKVVTVTVDPNFESEGIWVKNQTYWTESENVVLDVFFDHFEDQEPLQLKITGDVTGLNAGIWIPYAQNIPVTLNPTSSGNRRIFAQYKDVDGKESYYISKRIYLKPTISHVPNGADRDVSVSLIQDATSLTISGCTQTPTYTKVPHQLIFLCTPNAATIDVTWFFPNDTTLTKSIAP